MSIAVTKAGGYVCTLERVRTWLESQGISVSEDRDINRRLKKWLKEQSLHQRLTPIVTDFPRGEKTIIFFIRRQDQDLIPNAQTYTLLEETESDRALKESILEYSGLAEEDLSWQTILDPFFKVRLLS
jgi:hypothetical protein